MKKIIALIMAMAMVLCLAACGSNGTAGSGSASGDVSGDPAAYTTVEAGKLIMSTNAEFPPYEMKADDEGAYKGFEGIDVEIAVALADKLGLELVIDDMGFDSALLAVQEGRSDMVLAGLTYREDRDEVMDFSTSYATGVQVVIVKEGSDVTMDNLGEKMIGCQIGTTGYIYAGDSVENGGYGEDHVLGYDNGALAVQALMNGQIDAVIIDNGPAQAYVKANPGLAILEGEWVTEDYCLAVDEGNTALLEALNTALESMIADGTIQTIVDKYITE
ncbi:MAG: amino acid ABC transporter substrate-binding protein [Oscillospiraceae bacterium]|nr:amino acid ABC transporter substrate-binding protein [Oscillospiraceae bacterium]